MLGSAVREIAEGRKPELLVQVYLWVSTRANGGHTDQPPSESLLDSTPLLEEK